MGEEHRRHLGVAALVLWLGAVGVVVALWASASATGCVAPSWDGCAVDDVHR
jgi:hypothetical protein